MKGQAATEYIIITAVILAALIPIFYYTFSELSRTTKINQASDAVNILARKAEAVHALGQGSRDYVWISIPNGVSDVIINNETIRVSFYDLGDVAAFPKVNVTGTIPVAAGTYRVVVEMLENVVVIGPVNDTTPPIITGTSPDGIVRISNPVLSATTNEPATCKFSSTDEDYNSMPTQMSGSGLGHTTQLNNLANGMYLFYVRCIDRFDNVMQASSTINFSVILDIMPPIIKDTSVNDTSVLLDGYICINATITDSGGIFNAWAMVSTPLDSPLPEIVNYTMSDTAQCAGIASDNIYGVSIKMQATGIWYVNTTFAEDIADNLGFESPYPNILINVSSLEGSQGVPGTPGNALFYMMSDKAYYFKTSTALGINESDDQLTLTDRTLNLADEDKNTPPSSSRFFYTSVGNKYEGYIFQINRSKNDFIYYSLRVKTVDAQEIPYNLTVYAYDTDGKNILTTNTTAFIMNNTIISGVNRGFNEVDITHTVLAGKSQFIKIRVAPQTVMGGEASHISEADIGVFA